MDTMLIILSHDARKAPATIAAMTGMNEAGVRTTIARHENENGSNVRAGESGQRLPVSPVEA